MKCSRFIKTQMSPSTAEEITAHLNSDMLFPLKRHDLKLPGLLVAVTPSRLQHPSCSFHVFIFLSGMLLLSETFFFFYGLKAPSTRGTI